MNKKNNIVEIIFWILIGLLSIYRLYLTGDRDIIQSNSPHDEFWYIKNAINNIFGGEYSQMSFIHLPIYSMWLKISSILGVSARFSIDFLWVLACIYLVYAFIKLIKIHIIGLFLFLYLSFHPYTFQIFDRALAENLLTVISALVIASAIELWINRDNKGSFRWNLAIIIYVTGSAFGYHTRSEGILYVIPLIALTILSIFRKDEWWVGVQKKKVAFPLLIYPFLSIATLSVVISTAHFIKTGVYARYDLEHPGYVHALSAINKISAGETEKHVTASRNVLSIGYNESVTLAELKPYFDNESGKMWRQITEQSAGIKGEIANGWFYWALRDAAFQAGWYKDAKYADIKFENISNELKNSFKSGKINYKSFAISSFLDPDYGKWIPDLPRSIINVVNLVLYPGSFYIEKVENNATKDQADIYTEITGKRREPPKIWLSGWTVLPEGTLIELDAGTSNSKAVEILTKKRPDVAGAYAINLEVPKGDIKTAVLKYYTPDKRYGELMFSELKLGEVVGFKGNINAPIGVDSLNYGNKKKRLDNLNGVLDYIYKYIGYLSILIFTLVLITSLTNFNFNACYVLFIICSLAVFARIFLISIIDASSYNAIQSRYLLPVTPEFSIMIFIGFHIVVKKIIKCNYILFLRKYTHQKDS
jgi:hypothetical protein